MQRIPLYALIIDTLVIGNPLGTDGVSSALAHAPFLGAPPPGCRVDVNFDGQVTVLDVAEFINSWLSRMPDADWDFNGAINNADVAGYINAWFQAVNGGAGC